MRRYWVIVAALLAVLGFCGTASAAQLIDRNATGVQIRTNTKGEMLLTYRKGGAVKHVLVWGAINADQPAKGLHQVKFKLDYSGGYGKYHKVYWKVFGGSCGTYDGPALPNLVAACKAADGSYWAAQSWQQPLPDLGFTPWTPALSAKWLEVSHWSGDLPTLEVHMGWVYSGFQQVFGRYMYQGQPVYGFGTTSVGAPTDNFGRLIYLDTYDSVYGSGWRRENSFVPHNPTGAFCYGFYPFDPTKGGYQHPPGYAGGRRGPGIGTHYRLTASGTGVTPNISVTIPSIGAYDASKAGERQAADALLRSYGDKSCLAGLTGG
ncbi:MAG: hypothetical protein ABUS54_13595 [Actinomycetota bacterium]